MLLPESPAAHRTARAAARQSLTRLRPLAVEVDHRTIWAEVMDFVLRHGSDLVAGRVGGLRDPDLLADVGQLAGSLSGLVRLAACEGTLEERDAPFGVFGCLSDVGAELLAGLLLELVEGGGGFVIEGCPHPSPIAIFRIAPLGYTGAWDTHVTLPDVLSDPVAGRVLVLFGSVIADHHVSQVSCLEVKCLQEDLDDFGLAVPRITHLRDELRSALEAGALTRQDTFGDHFDAGDDEV